MIEQLAKDHSEWIQIARSVCGDRDLANDLVQDMYLKLHDAKGINNVKTYVFSTIRNLYTDSKRKQGRMPTDSIDVNEIEVIDETEVIPEQLNANEADYAMVKTAFDSLPFHKREVLRYSYIDGLKPFARESKISFWYISKIRKEFKESIWQQQKEKSQQELETLLQASLRQLDQNLAKAASSEKIFLM